MTRSVGISGLKVHFPAITIGLPTLELPSLTRYSGGARMEIEGGVAPFMASAFGAGGTVVTAGVEGRRAAEEAGRREEEAPEEERGLPPECSQTTRQLEACRQKLDRLEEFERCVRDQMEQIEGLQQKLQEKTQAIEELQRCLEELDRYSRVRVLPPSQVGRRPPPLPAPSRFGREPSRSPESAHQPPMVGCLPVRQSVWLEPVSSGEAGPLPLVRHLPPVASRP